MKKVKIGVLGGYRGSSMINYCKHANNAEIVAICDKSPEVIESQQKDAEGFNITFYSDFEDFIKHDMDAVVLANYANEHAPFAIRCLKAGKHVFSEVLPANTMKEAVELIEAVEESGLVYAYGENYCYMSAPYEMRKLYKEGKLGKFEYGECEYLHNCAPIWHCLTYGERDHWRNNVYSTAYCTHSFGPIVHATGLRPVSVIGLEGEASHRKEKVGAKSADFGMEIVTMENGAIVKSIHGGLYKDNIWYCMYGSKGRFESGREDVDGGCCDKIYVNVNDSESDNSKNVKSYNPQNYVEGLTPETLSLFGHGGSDFFSVYYFCEKILGNPDADTIDVYEAMDMFLPGMFAFRSILDGGKPKEIPNLRNKEERDKWRNDVACTNPDIAGDMVVPTRKGGTPDIPDSVYKAVQEKWEYECAHPEEASNYRASIFSLGNKKQDRFV